MLHGDPCVVDRWRFVHRYLRAGPLTAFDAGAGNGGFAFYAATRGNHVLGLSFSESELSAASRRAEMLGMRNVQFRVGDLRDLSSMHNDLGEFDQILCLEVIEHLLADQALIDCLARMLRPEGQLLLTAPSCDHRPLFGEASSEVEDGGHVRWGYDHGQLTRMVSEAGLTVVAAGHVSGIVSQKLTNLMRRGQRAVHPLFGWALVLPLRPLQLLDPLLTRLTRTPYLSVTCVAVRDAHDH
jgi:2-polyprenyl-3-methyl-5-hydroxy-6-metoxy-1,4-benzoquinol methylase